MHTHSDQWAWSMGILCGYDGQQKKRHDCTLIVMPVGCAPSMYLQLTQVPIQISRFGNVVSTTTGPIAYADLAAFSFIPSNHIYINQNPISKSSMEYFVSYIVCTNQLPYPTLQLVSQSCMHSNNYCTLLLLRSMVRECQFDKIYISYRL